MTLLIELSADYLIQNAGVQTSNDLLLILTVCTLEFCPFNTGQILRSVRFTILSYLDYYIHKGVVNYDSYATIHMQKKS